MVCTLIPLAAAEYLPRVRKQAGVMWLVLVSVREDLTQICSDGLLGEKTTTTTNGANTDENSGNTSVAFAIL